MSKSLAPTALDHSENRRRLIQRAGAAGAGAMLAAGGVRGHAAAQDATPGAAAAPAAPAGNTPAGPAVERLLMWTRASPDDPGSPNLYAQLAARCEAYRVATGTTVEIQTVPDADFRPRMSAAAPGGEGPDVFGPCAHDWIGEFAIQQIALPMPEGALEGIDDFTPASRTLSSIDGTLFGAPLQVESVALIYNADMVPTPPTTWDELVQMANGLNSGEIYGFGFPLLECYHEGGFWMGFGSYVFGYDGTTFNTTDIGLNNAAGAEAIRFLRDMYHTQMPLMPDAVIDRTNMAGVIEGMQEAGQLGMTINGPWRINPLQTAGINYGVAVLPTLPNGQPMRPFVGVQAMLVNAYSEQQEAAIDLTNFLAGTDSQAAYFLSDRKVPARLSAQQAESVASDPWVATWAQQAEAGMPMPNIAQMSSVWTPWAGYVDAIVAANAPDDEIQGYLDQLVAEIAETVAG